jgi:hypothetical protein
LLKIGERGIIQSVNSVRSMVALVFLAFWPVMTSHPLLQQLGVIHQVHEDHDDGAGSHEHDTDNHACADGDYLKGSNSISVWKPFASVAAPFVTTLLFSTQSFARLDMFSSGPAPPGTAPPELSNIWQFSFRAALPARAPSLIS